MVFIYESWLLNNAMNYEEKKKLPVYILMFSKDCDAT